MSGHSGKHTPGYYREENETSYVDGNREHLLITSGGEATDAEYARVMLAQPYPWTEDEIQAALEENASGPFRLMR
jgi:hypothetical protein